MKKKTLSEDTGFPPQEKQGTDSRILISTHPANTYFGANTDVHAEVRENTQRFPQDNSPTQKSVELEAFLPDYKEADRHKSEPSSGKTFPGAASASPSGNRNLIADHFHDVYTGDRVPLRSSFLSSSVSSKESSQRGSLQQPQIDGEGRHPAASKHLRYRASTNIQEFMRNSSVKFDIDDSDDEISCNDSFDKKIDMICSNFQSNAAFQPGESMSIASLEKSFLSSLTFDELNDREKERRKRRSIRMSMVSRRSMRMSFALRQSLLDPFGENDIDDEGEADDEGDKTRVTGSRQIPDVFSSRYDRRRSTITESSAMLISTVFGEEAARNPERGSFLMESILAPILPEDIMMEMSDSDF